jgi:transposase
MQKVTHRTESTGATAALYMAMELSATQWHLVFGVGVATAVRHRTIPAGAVAQLREEIRRARTRFALPADAPVRSCYEAGRDGFWVHRCVTAAGVENLVVDSSSIEVDRRRRRAKTDRLDGTRLFRKLVQYWSGDRDTWKVVAVPSEALEDTRHAERGLATLTAERTTWRNRIHALLMLAGVRTAIGADFGERLATLRTWAGAPLPPGLTGRLQQAWRMLAAVNAELRTARAAQQAEVAAAETAPAQLAAQLQRLHGVGVATATVLAKELFSRDLHNRREVGALTGLVGVPYASGAMAHDQGISRAGLSRIRGLAVELAWLWRRYQPHSALTAWFNARFGAGGKRARKVGIVALARRLIVALWRYTRTGIAPAGATLR